MKPRTWLVLVAAALVMAGGFYLASPLLTFRALGQAAEAGDARRLEQLVDFPRVRASLKDQLGARLIGALQGRAQDDGPFGALGALLGPRIVDQVVDVMVTPAGVAAILRTGRAPMVDGGAPPTALPPPGAEPATKAEEDRRTRFSYDGLDRFRATTTTARAPDAPLAWVMERRGLFGWKLIAIELPPA